MVALIARLVMAVRSSNRRARMDMVIPTFPTYCIYVNKKPDIRLNVLSLLDLSRMLLLHKNFDQPAASLVFLIIQ